MATTTSNMGLTLPAVSDAADISVLNANFDKIDEKCNPALFAPAGYGLGTGCKNIDSVLNINANGWYITEGDTPNGTWWLCHAFVTNNGADAVVEAYSLDGRLKCKRKKNSGVWGDFWYWYNPYFAPGGEYPTPEQWNGKTVYAKRVSTGALTNGGNFTLLNEGETPIRCSVSADGHILPYYAGGALQGGSWSIWYDITDNTFTAYMGSSLTSVSYDVTVWYVKN